MTFPWWAWLVTGLVLMVAELLVTSGFFLFFFGVGAVSTALLFFFIGLTDSFLNGFVYQGIAFFCISVLCIVLLRKPLLTRFHFRNHHPAVNSLLGQHAKALESIAPRAVGKVELYGTSWSALNTGESAIPLDTLCKVHHVEGLTLHVTG